MASVRCCVAEVEPVISRQNMNQKSLPVMHQEVLDDRTQRKRRENVSAPTMTTVPTSRPTNSGPCVGNVPLVTGIFFFAARLPAAARAE